MSVALLCAAAGTTRQNYYQQRSIRQRLSMDETLLLELVSQQRALQPCIGARKLLYLLQSELAGAGVSIGRDRFLRFLRKHALLIERRARCATTTDSWHGYRVYPNLAKDLVLRGPHQLLLSDITYLRTTEGFMYLCLVSDGFSRCIVGYDCSDSLEMEGALRALKRALKQLPTGAGAMHHSDRGSQYCCGQYIRRLKRRGVLISMTEQNHCYENSQAERLNGILKQEYGLGQTFRSKALVAGAVKEAVMLFNHHRPHTALSFRKPIDVHRGAAA